MTNLDPDQVRLEQNMERLDDGLNEIADRYQRHVAFVYEDPETFGAGHFVLYPAEGSATRFAIEEQYTDTDWSDPDRLATSWTWADERDELQPDGRYRYVARARGEIASDDVAELLNRAEEWARLIYSLAARAEDLHASPLTLRVISPRGTNLEMR